MSETIKTAPVIAARVPSDTPLILQAFPLELCSYQALARFLRSDAECHVGANCR